MSERERVETNAAFALHERIESIADFKFNISAAEASQVRVASHLKGKNERFDERRRRKASIAVCNRSIYLAKPPPSQCQ